MRRHMFTHDHACLLANTKHREAEKGIMEIDFWSSQVLASSVTSCEVISWYQDKVAPVVGYNYLQFEDITWRYGSVAEELQCDMAQASRTAIFILRLSTNENAC